MLKMKVIWLYLNAFLSRILGESVILMSDSATVVAYLKKQGNMVSGVMCSMALENVVCSELHMGTLTSEIHSLEKEHAS